MASALDDLAENYGDQIKNGVIAGAITCLNLFLPNMIKAISLNEIHATHSDMQASMMTKLTVSEASEVGGGAERSKEIEMISKRTPMPDTFTLNFNFTLFRWCVS